MSGPASSDVHTALNPSNIDANKALATSLRFTRYKLSCYRCGSSISHSLVARLVRCPVCTTVNAVCEGLSVPLEAHLASPVEQVMQWQAEQVAEFLTNIGVDPQTVAIVKAKNVDGPQLFDLTYADFLSFGIQHEQLIYHIMYTVSTIRASNSFASISRFIAEPVLATPGGEQQLESGGAPQ